MHLARRIALTAATAVSAVALLSGCIPQTQSQLSDLAGLGAWLETSAIVESIEQSSEPGEQADSSELQIFSVDLADEVTPDQLTELLDELAARMKGHAGRFAGGRIRFAIAPGVNEFSVETQPQSIDGQFAAATELWFDLNEQFETFTVDLRYVDRGGWATERIVTVDLGAASWSDSTAALRTLTQLGAFDPDGEGTASSTLVRSAPPSPWWSGSAEVGFDVGSAPSDEILSLLDALSPLQADGTAAFDFSSNSWGAEQELGVHALLPAGSAAGDGQQSLAWATATRLVDLLATSGVPFTLYVAIDGETAPFATVASDCAVTETPFSQQLTDYFTSTGGTCAA